MKGRSGNLEGLQLIGIITLVGLFLVVSVTAWIDSASRNKQAADQKKSIDELMASVGNSDAFASKLVDRMIQAPALQKLIKNYASQSSQEALQAMMGQIARGNSGVSENIIGSMEKKLLEIIEVEGRKVRQGLFTPKELSLINAMIQGFSESVSTEAKTAQKMVLSSVPRIQVPVAPPPAATEIQANQQKLFARLEEVDSKVDKLMVNSVSSGKAIMPDESLSQIREMLKDLGDQIRFQSRAISTAPSSSRNKSRCLVLNWSKSLNASPAEVENLVSELRASKGFEPGASSNNSFLFIQDFQPKKTIKPIINSAKALEAFIGGNGPVEGRPVADELPGIVTEQVPGSSVGIDQLVVVTGHEFRFKKEDLSDWNRFRTVVFVLVEGPVPEYFEWTYFSKLKAQRQKVPGLITEVKIFKKQNERGLGKEEIRELARLVGSVAD